MKSYLFFAFFAWSILIACNGKSVEQTKTPTNTPPQDEVKNSPSSSAGKQAECYKYLGKRDTVYLQLSEVYGTMTGMLLYKNSNKDQIVGTLMGNMTGDVFIADFSYTKDAVKTVRQVAFKKKDNDFLEGFGEMSTVDNKKVFNDVKSLRFDETRLFTNVPCKQ